MSEQVGTPLRGNKSDGWESYPYLSESFLRVMVGLIVCLLLFGSRAV